MSKISAFNLSIQVEQMRNAQKLYFAQIKVAKGSKKPADFAMANNTLKLSKQLEALVDDTITDVQNATGVQSIIDQDATIAMCVKAMQVIHNNLLRLFSPTTFRENIEFQNILSKLRSTVDIAEEREPLP